MKKMPSSFLWLLFVMGALMPGHLSAAVEYDANNPQLAFAAQEIKAALRETGTADLQVSLIVKPGGASPESFEIRTNGTKVEITGRMFWRHTCLWSIRFSRHPARHATSSILEKKMKNTYRFLGLVSVLGILSPWHLSAAVEYDAQIPQVTFAAQESRDALKEAGKENLHVTLTIKPKVKQVQDQESLENELRDLRRDIVKKNPELMALWDESMNLKGKIEEVKTSDNKDAIKAARKAYEESLKKIDLRLFKLDADYKAFYDEVYKK